MTRIELDDDQKKAVDRMVREPTKAALNGSLYGTGKTVVTVETAYALGGKINLIVCPVSTRMGWRETILRQYPDVSVRIIDSTKRGKDNLASLVSLDAGWYIVGRELFATKNIQEALRLKWKHIDFLAYDECQKWANRKSQGFRAMKQVKPGYKMALSATPYGNKFQNMWAITKWLWPDLNGGFWNWVTEWCDQAFDPFAGTVVRGPIKSKPQDAYVNSLPCYVRLEVDYGEPEEYELEVTLSSAERKIYEEFNKYLIVWLQENPLIASVPMVKRMRLRQMTLGMVSYDPVADMVYYEDDMKSTKYDALTGIIDQMPGEPLLILTHSAKYARIVAEKLRADGHSAAPWTGDVSQSARELVKSEFLAGNVDYIVATIASIGEGVDGLQHRARVMVWLSRDDNNMLNQQAFRRLHRRGQERQVISIDIVAKDTYDRGQLDNLIQQQVMINESLRKK